ncbi:MAG: S46 family peptidase [Bacteroidetes bacterium]|nr:S46 family peptidase [Bacteroidota bacterium]MDA0904394.1 S46 family peptidase [Bacteroidota bacterium]MDA1243033.1 S46 family peptidase [Bacteroidota bacterium]
MKRFTTLGAVFMLLFSQARADEGMWLLHMLQKINEAGMQESGLRLSAQDIYDINNASLKDAIVRLNGGSCTAEVISSQGLVLTNHHCAYGAIQSFSAPEHDYLTDGFWAKSKDQEMHIDDFYVSFLVRIDDVTERVLATVNDDMPESERAETVAAELKAIQGEYMEANPAYSYDMKTMYYGNEFYVFTYQDYRDIRLVAAPPESVGKYGGDTDNWMWPRHTGDFSMVRIYADADNNPAEFSDDNVPYIPKRHLKISMAGVDQGDYTMIMGYPGSTDRFLSSWGVEQAINLYNPSVVECRDLKLKTMKSHMDSDKGIRIKYAAKYAQTANYWKYYIGQTKGLKRLEVQTQKQKLEELFTRWVDKDAGRQETYGEALDLIASYYAETDATVRSEVYAREAGLLGSDIVLFALRVGFRAGGLFDEDANRAAGTRAMLEGLAESHFKDYDQDTDRDMFVNMLTKYRDDIDPALWPSAFQTVQDKYKGDFAAYAEKIYSKSPLRSADAFAEFLANPKQKTLDSDLAVTMAMSIYERYSQGTAAETQEKFDRGYRLFVRGLREMQPEKAWYPDANSTMRLTYGPVGDYKPADAVHYDFVTTANGILEKKDNSNAEFIVPERLEQLIKARDFGPYADENGELVVCFIHGTDITGGNSGSPVMNADGDLIGLAFDGNWEAMSGDIAFEHQLQRTISVDIRYVMWILDKYAGCTNLIEEMDFVYASDEPADPANAEPQLSDPAGGK